MLNPEMSLMNFSFSYHAVVSYSTMINKKIVGIILDFHLLLQYDQSHHSHSVHYLWAVYYDVTYQTIYGPAINAPCWNTEDQKWLVK